MSNEVYQKVDVVTITKDFLLLLQPRIDLCYIKVVGALCIVRRYYLNNSIFFQLKKVQNISVSSSKKISKLNSHGG